MEALGDAKRAEQAAERLAHTDTLTGLPNRRALEKRLQEISQQADADGQYGVLFIDGDNFKRINDELGHARGDEVLQGSAKVIMEAVRAGEGGRDKAYRLGGDEFVVLMYLGPQGNSRRTDQLTTSEQLGRVGERVHGELTAFLQENPDIAALDYGLSIGAAWPDGTSTLAKMLETAEGNMRDAKQGNHDINGSYR